MDNDILTRLKNAEHVGPNGITKLNVAQLLLNREAVREIERLRAEIDGLTIRVFTLLKKLEEK